MKIVGSIYLHDISQSRIAPAKENLQMFNTFCTPDAVGGVTFATTKWGDIPDTVGQKRQAQLVSEGYCTTSAVAKFDGTYQSAHDIIGISLKSEPVDAQLIQEELANLQKRLSPKLHNPQTIGFFTFLFGRRRATVRSPSAPGFILPLIFFSASERKHLTTQKSEAKFPGQV